VALAVLVVLENLVVPADQLARVALVRLVGLAVQAGIQWGMSGILASSLAGSGLGLLGPAQGQEWAPEEDTEGRFAVGIFRLGMIPDPVMETTKKGAVKWGGTLLQVDQRFLE